MSVRRMLLAACSAVALTVPLTVVGAVGAVAAPSPTGQAHRAARVCETPAVGHVACNSLVLVDAAGKPKGTSTPAGYGPSQLRDAYNLAAAAASGGSGVTVAIVDAYDDPNALADLTVYRSYFGLPALNQNGGPTFAKVNQAGDTAPLPAANSGWAEEISLDLDMVSAICPNCNILLVEADSASFADLGVAVDSAVALGAAVVSNSYGGSESSSDSVTAASYDHPGVAITASSGDNGYGVESPASFSTVTAVGGTSLTASSSASRGWVETAWSGAGSGCSAYVAQPSWQQNLLTSVEESECGRRVVADVSAVADPYTGVAVYDTYGLNRRSAGWLVFGGTSVAVPIIGSVYALAGGLPAGSAGAGDLYSHASAATLFDVTSGSNGSCPASTGATATSSSGGTGTARAAANRPGRKPGHGGGGGGTTSNTYLCQAGTGYDGPTGLGTPNGVGAF